MNGWDAFTWAMILVLFGGSIVVFVGFLRDLRGVVRSLYDRVDPK